MLNNTWYEFKVFKKKTKMLKNKDFSNFQTLRYCFHHAHNVKMSINCWHFSIHEHDKFHAQLNISCLKLSHGMKFQTMWYVTSAQAQTSLRIQAV